MRDVNFEKELDKTLHFVALQLDKTGHNTKPVLFHSFKVSYILYNNGYDKDIILSGALHDLLEDTEVDEKEILSLYNKNILDIVRSVSFNKNIKDKKTQAIDLFKRCKDNGKPALIVKCADLLDNINYVDNTSVDMKRKLLKKYALFLDIAKSDIKDEKIYIELKEKYDKKIGGING